MKNYLVVLLLLLSVQAFGQTPKVIVLDFKTKTFSPEIDCKSYHHGDLIQLKIKNFNPFLYTVQLSKNDSAFPMNKATDAFNIFSIDALTKATINMSDAVGKLAGKIADNAAKMPTGKQFIRAESVQIDQDSIRAADSIMQLFSNKFLAHQKSLSEFKNRAIDEPLLNIQKTLLQAKLVIINDNDPSTPFNLENYVTAMDGFIREKTKLFAEIKSTYNDYVYAAAPYIYVIIHTPGLLLIDTLINQYNHNIQIVSVAMDTTLNLNNVARVSNILLNLNKDNFQYVSLPQQITKDYAILNIDIRPIASNTGLQPYSTNINLPLDQKGFWGFSTGFYCASLNNDLFSTKTNIVKNSSGKTDTTYQLVQESKGGEIGITAQFHAGWRIGRNVNFAIGFGPGYSIQKKPQPRLLLGGGFAFGRSNSLIINGGAIVGYVSRRSNAYSGDLSTQYAAPQTDVTVNRLGLGAYFGLNYIIFNN